MEGEDINTEGYRRSTPLNPFSFSFTILLSLTSNLPVEDDGELPDPYVKLYLLPDRSKDSKRKTDVIKDNCNPQYDERFEYALPPNELTKRTLEVTVINKKGLMFLQRSPKMGQVGDGVSCWYGEQVGDGVSCWEGGPGCIGVLLKWRNRCVRGHYSVVEEEGTGEVTVGISACESVFLQYRTSQGLNGIQTHGNDTQGQSSGKVIYSQCFCKSPQSTHMLNEVKFILVAF